jgi:prenylcysteine oxidase/farnesylcysteine lyase
MLPLFLSLLALLPVLPLPHASGDADICIVGGGISGASTAFFLTNYTTSLAGAQLRVFERRHKAGGRLGTVTLAGDSFEAGGSIIHPRNLHARRFADLLGLAAKVGGDDDWLGIWDGKSFIFQTLRPPPTGSSWWRRKLHSLLNSLLLLRRYGLSLLKMDKFVQVNSSFSTVIILPPLVSRMHRFALGCV